MSEMYKVVFVDDEEQNLFLMEKIIDWEELGFRVSGMALDGREGIEMYKETRPDLMLVDIKMNEMDGLALIQKLREEYGAEETLFIIVTAYDEFSYAQQAIQLNVENYLLKPLERRKLAEMIRKIKKRLDQKKEKRMRQLLLGKQQGTFIFEMAWIQLWETFIKGGMDVPGLEGVEAVIAGNTYRSFLLFSPNVEDGELLEIVKAWNINFFFQRQDGVFGIVREEDWRRVLDGYEELRKAGWKKCYILQMNASFSNEYEFADSMRQFVDSRYQCFYEEKSRAYLSGEKKRYVEKNREIPVNELLKKLLYQGKSREAEEMLKEMIEDAKKGQENPMQLTDSMIDILYQMKIQLTWIYKERAFALLRHKNLWMLHEFHTAKKLQREMEQVFSEVAAEVLEMKNDKSNHAMMGKIMDFIQCHYRDSEFSAIETAEAVNLSRNYLMKIFKEEKGVSFWDYVTYLRMEKAKELLKTTNQTIYSISLEIGYESQYHFSRKFKALFGVSPLEFRNL